MGYQVISVTLLIVACIIQLSTSGLLNDEAWGYYRQSLIKVLSIKEDANRVMTLVTSPSTKEEFLGKINYVQQQPDSGDTFQISPIQTQCEKIKSSLSQLGDVNLFVAFKREESKCGIRVVKSTVRPVSNFKIQGSSLISQSGGSLHQKQAFIAANGQKEVVTKAFNPRGLTECKNAVGSAYFNANAPKFIREEFRALILQNQKDDDDKLSEEDVQEFVDDVMNHVQSVMEENDEFLFSPQQLQQIQSAASNQQKMVNCLKPKLKKLIVDADAMSIKEFELEYKLQKLEVVDVQNEALSESLARRIKIGYVPRQILIAHQPQIEMSFSHDDFLTVKSAFNGQKALTIGGMKFDRMKILAQDDDDDELFPKIFEFVKRVAHSDEGATCGMNCLNTYDASSESEARKEFNLSQCMCICREGYNSKTGYNRKEAELADARAKCGGSSRRYRVELSSSGTEVVAVISDKY